MTDKPKRSTLTAKDKADLKVLIQYEVKPLRDEVKRLSKKLDKMCQDKKEKDNG